MYRCYQISVACFNSIIALIFLLILDAELALVFAPENPQLFWNFLVAQLGKPEKGPYNSIR